MRAWWKSCLSRPRTSRCSLVCWNWIPLPTGVPTAPAMSPAKRDMARVRTNDIALQERAGVRGGARSAHYHVRAQAVLTFQRPCCLDQPGGLTKMGPHASPGLMKTSLNPPSLEMCWVKFPQPISGFRTFGLSRFMEHSSDHEESRGIEGGPRPEITKARNNESPKSTCFALDRGQAPVTRRQAEAIRATKVVRSAQFRMAQLFHQPRRSPPDAATPQEYRDKPQKAE
jgi:hypothetical protein